MRHKSWFISITIMLALLFWQGMLVWQHSKVLPTSAPTAAAQLQPNSKERILPIVASSAATTKTGLKQFYPDPLLTPGNVFAEVSAAQVCTPGYSAKVRHVPENERKQVFAAYGIAYPPSTDTYELDHFISLELGGSNDAQNLWPEPANPQPGFHEKDVVENYLHAQVCSGKMSLSAAQQVIQSDWYAAYQDVYQAK